MIAIIPARFAAFIPSSFTRKFRLIAILLGGVHLLIVGAIALFFQPSTDPVVLRYNVYFGIDILAAWWQVQLLPLLSAIFIAINLFLARRFLRLEQPLLALLLLLGSGIITAGLAVAVAAIVFINY